VYLLLSSGFSLGFRAAGQLQCELLDRPIICQLEGASPTELYHAFDASIHITATFITSMIILTSTRWNMLSLASLWPARLCVCGLMNREGGRCVAEGIMNPLQ
jgi:hypothetical protein